MAKTTETSQILVRKGEPVLVTPAKPTPHEVKELSDIDDQEGLRFLSPMIFLYKNLKTPTLCHKDHSNPAKVIQKALAKVLVHYYPFAGRLREGSGRKLTVDCTGEGVVFVEAEAEATLEEIGEVLHPPFSCMDKLLYDDHVSGIVGSPLLFFQVTRFKCGGFTLSCRQNHTMGDAAGMFQFLYAVAEIARGSATEPSILPVWQRHLLRARASPSITHLHDEYEYHHCHDPNAKDITPMLTYAATDLRTFYFSNRHISVLRSLVPPHLRARCSNFELLTAFLWQYRTIALQPQPNELVRVLFTINARDKLNPPIPAGYYGNAFLFCGVTTTAGELCKSPFGYAIELVKRAKAKVTEEYIRSLVDYLAIKGRPRFVTGAGTFLATDHTRIPIEALDFGWGRPVYGGSACDGDGDIRAAIYSRFRDQEGNKKGTSVMLRLPELAMERLVLQLQALFSEEHVDNTPSLISPRARRIVSSL